MRSFWTPASAALLALTLVPAYAANGKVALLPAHVSSGAAENGKVVTDALRANLEKQGFDVLPASTVDSAMQAQHTDLSRPQTTKTLTALRTATGADFVVYPRVLRVGTGLNSDEYQATILLNVQGSNPRQFAHTRQIGQIFHTPTPVEPKRAVIGQADAEEAATKLFERFDARKAAGKK